MTKEHDKMDQTLTNLGNIIFIMQTRQLPILLEKLNVEYTYISINLQVM